MTVTAAAPAASLRQLATAWQARAEHAVLHVAPIATRLLLGPTFLLTGLGKLRNFAQTAEFFAGLGIPLPEANAAFVGTVELVGGACLVLGLGTRIAAALLASTMVVALLTADRLAFLSAIRFANDTGPTDVTPLVFLVLLLWLIALGAGPLAADRWLSRRKTNAAC